MAESLYLTTISQAELLAGIEVLPDGQRKSGLTKALNTLLESLFESRILSFDQRAAATYAPLIATARSNGQAISFADGQIAAIAAVYGFTVATRDKAPFLAAEIPVIDPWQK